MYPRRIAAAQRAAPIPVGRVGTEPAAGSARTAEQQ